MHVTADAAFLVRFRELRDLPFVFGLTRCVTYSVDDSLADPSANTTVVFKSLVRVAMATDTEPALPGGYARYIVVVKVFWYDAEGYRQGWAKQRLTHYNRVNQLGDEVADGRSCPPGFA